MKLSEFEKIVLMALIENDPEREIILAQLSNATVIEREYSGVGLFTNIEVDENTPRLSKSNRYIEETPKTHLVHPELDHGAGALLWFEGGKVAMLECYTYVGDWPTNEAGFKVRSQ